MSDLTPETHPDLQWGGDGRLRVRIVQAEGQPLDAGFVAADPPKAQANMRKEGWCEVDAPHPAFGTNPKITLDDGTVIWGFECWWEPVHRADYVTPFPTGYDRGSH